jgi:hypothetical protein
MVNHRQFRFLYVSLRHSFSDLLMVGKCNMLVAGKTNHFAVELK